MDINNKGFRLAKNIKNKKLSNNCRNDNYIIIVEMTSLKKFMEIWEDK